MARCESSGNWSSTVGKYEGGIQFHPNTWDAYGGEQYAPSADQATREQQIAVGRKVLADQGYGAWPGCSAKTGWEDGGTSSSSSQPAQRQRSSGASDSASSTRSAPARESVPRRVIVVPPQSVPTLDVKPKAVPPGGSTWTVAVGDTLTKIASIKRVDWTAIHKLNPDVVEHPDWIFPGEQLVIPAPTR